MWYSRLFWKVFLSYAVLNLLLALLFLLLSARWQRQQAMRQVQDRLHDSAVILRSFLQGQRELSTEDLQRRVHALSQETGLHISYLSADGAVLADSERRHLDSAAIRLDQPELEGARATGVGTDRRHAAGSELPLLYLALPLADEGGRRGFVRLSERLDVVHQQANLVQRLVWSLAGSMGLLALVLTYIVVGRLLRPIEQLTDEAQAIAQGNLGQEQPFNRADEIGKLASAFFEMRQQLQSKMTEAQEGSERLEAVLANMQEGVVAVDADERILLANKASRRLLAFSTREVIGRPLREVTRNRSLHDAVTKAFHTGEPCTAELEVPGATRRVLALRAQWLSGAPQSGVLMVLHDVTELRRLENLRRDFVANVSHELKTPLSSIKAYAETLQLGAVHDPENNMLFVNRIEEQAERLHELIVDLMHLARVETGQQALDIQDVPVDEVAFNCVRAHEDFAHNKQIRLATEPPASATLARVDEEGLRTILNNLIDNAVKYTPSGGTVAVRWWQDAAGVQVEVEDTGIGIARRDQERIFERFFRVDKARSREMGSTGLGLSIVKHLAIAFGGSIHVSSELGQGSTFRATLPACVPAPELA